MKKLRTLSGLLFGSVFFLMLLVGSAGEHSTAEAPVRVMPNFDFKPPQEGSSASNGISLVLLQPRYDSEYLRYYRHTEPHKSFIQNMATDFVELLAAKGFAYVGPIGSHDELVHSQKKNADLVLQVEMTWVETGMQSALRYKDTYNYLTKQTIRKYYYDGQGSFGGRLNMWLYEPFTVQKVWVKAINIEPASVIYKSQFSYDSEDIPDTDPSVWNAIVPEMEKIYNKILATAWNHLDVEELEQVKKEANEISENSGYRRN
jgi:hypothetical protein